ncbi:MGH1-like glycoside hydrolase domain-containing protein [Streptomyces sp. DW26H14]|uniref:MGH1-like glycoside hydrolase domain-containing protein n=1 Tax=Streptomyces sp. DW26H14 TaxID=3435395 RepID=UPI00403D687D
MTALARETPVDRPKEHAPLPGTGLARVAVQILLGNWTGASTIPSPTLYPHQWSWDSAFIAIGLRHLSPRRAQRELESLFGAQWADGRVPQIVFNPRVPNTAYFPSPDFWRSGRTAPAPRGLETSGIVQPPVHALAALLVHEADPGTSRARGFLPRLYPRLAAWHAYLTGRRDLGGRGLVSIVHPWEAGMDNSPCWDEPLSAVEPVPASAFRRADLTGGRASERPTDADYGRYVRLAGDYRDGGYRDDVPPAFAVEDPGFNALLTASEYALAAIAAHIGSDPRPHRERATALSATLVEHLWDPEYGMFLCHDTVAGRRVYGRSVTGLLPLILPDLPAEVTRALLRTLAGPHFGLGSTTSLVPSFDLLSDAYDPARYWRGPAWFNTNWLLRRGLAAHGAAGAARTLGEAMLEAAETSSFAEYVDPRTAQGRGTRDFSWTAAVVVDLLATEGQY